MSRHNFLVFLSITLIAMLCIFHPSTALCRLNLPEAEGSATIEGQDNQTLMDFFARFGEGEAQRSPDGQVRSILLAALPEEYKDACGEIVSQWEPDAAGTEAMSVNVLHVEGRKEDKPIRALVSYACFSRAPQYGVRLRDERLASLVVSRRVSRINMMPDETDSEDSPVLTRIRREKNVRIGGKGVVGLSFVKTNEDPSSKAGQARREWVNFYLMDDNRVRRAGTVLKGREEYAGGTDAGKSVYAASVIFKKDMKGNIIGILAPYTVTINGRRVDKGMVRYDWDIARQEFVKE